MGGGAPVVVSSPSARDPVEDPVVVVSPSARGPDVSPPPVSGSSVVERPVEEVEGDGGGWGCWEMSLGVDN